MTAPAQARAPVPRPREAQSDCVRALATRPPPRDRISRVQTPARNRLAQSHPSSPPACTGRTIGKRSSGSSEPVITAAIMATDIEQRRLSALAQGNNIDTRGNREKNVAGPYAFTSAIGRCLRFEVTPARFLRGFRYLDGLIKQQFDCFRCLLAGCSIHGCTIILAQQPGPYRGLSEQFRAGTLAQLVRCQRGVARMQRYTVDARHLTCCCICLDHHTLPQTPASGCRGRLCPAGTLSRRLRTTW